MRHHENVVRCCQGHHTARLGDAAQPCDVRLQDVRCLFIDQGLEAEARVLVLSRGEEEAQIAHCLFHFLVAIILIRRQELLHPGEVQVRLCQSTRQVDTVRHGEGHVAVKHQRETLPDEGPSLQAIVNVFLHALNTIRWPEGAWDLAANESKLLADVWPRSGGVHRQEGLGGPTQQHVDGLPPKLSQQIPKGKIHCGEGLDRQPLAAIVDRCAKHLVPHQLHVPRVLAFHKTGQVVLDDVAAWCTPDGDPCTARAIISLDLDNHAANGVDAPRLAVPLVCRVAGHRVRDRQELRRLTSIC
mmetsp:Transcript_141419/g.352605  ORF Transcript_141419/g.352605 Transcript_141419/m.352605 type:complete len:300 (-) Transcript_141419:205-1104(-)